MKKFDEAKVPAIKAKMKIVYTKTNACLGYRISQILVMFKLEVTILSAVFIVGNE